MSKEKNKLVSRVKTKEITKTILDICAMGGLVVLGGGGGTPEKAQGAWKELEQFSMSRIKECLKRLKLQTYIQYDENDLTKPIILTKKGLERYSINCLKEKVKSLVFKKWDRLWRLVTFDIKEKQRYKRDKFRRHLKDLNFFQLQKNIFVTPFPIENEIEELAKTCYMLNNVLILEVANLGKREKEVKKYFLTLHKKN